MVLVGALLMIPFSAAVNGYVLSVLWAWFVVPTFGAERLKVLPAIGLAMVAGKLTSHLSQRETKTKGLFAGEILGMAAMETLVSAAMFLGFGFVVHALM